MSSVYELLNENLLELSLPPEKLHEFPEEEARDIYEKAKSEFVAGNPRVWWLGLKREPTSIPIDDDFHFLANSWPKDEDKCYFIPENDADPVLDPNPHSHVPRVFELGLEALIQILGNNNGFFEYYLIGKDFSWLMIETDHNEFLTTKV